MTQSNDRISRTASALRARSLAVCKKLFDGKYFLVEGNHFITSNIRGTHPKRRKLTDAEKKRGIGKGSLVVWLDTGLWKDYARTEHRGDLINLIYHVRGCVSISEALAIADREFLGLPIEEGKASATPITTSNDKNRHVAEWLFNKVSQTIWSSPGEVYLSAGRGLDLRAAAPETMMTIARQVRYVPDAFHSRGVKSGCVLTKILDTAGAVILGVHKIFVQPSGAMWEGDRPKQTLGQINGGAAHFGEPDDGRLVLAEAIEDGIAGKLALPELALWAATSAGHLMELVLPDHVNFVIVASDDDPAGDLAYETLKERYPAMRFERYRPATKDINADVQGIGLTATRERFTSLL